MVRNPTDMAVGMEICSRDPAAVLMMQVDPFTVTLLYFDGKKVLAWRFTHLVLINSIKMHGQLIWWVCVDLEQHGPFCLSVHPSETD